jgi:hypothetical protein
MKQKGGKQQRISAQPEVFVCEKNQWNW